MSRACYQEDVSHSTAESLRLPTYLDLDHPVLLMSVRIMRIYESTYEIDAEDAFLEVRLLDGIAD
jgi:hypothetical protein